MSKAKKPYPPTPELDKLKLVRHRSEEAHSFLEFLAEKDLAVCEPSVEVPGFWLRTTRSVDDLLSEYVGIDLKKIDAEKQAILDWIRQQDEAAS